MVRRGRVERGLQLRGHPGPQALTSRDGERAEYLCLVLLLLLLELEEALTRRPQKLS